MVVYYALFGIALFPIWHGPVQKKVLGLAWGQLGKTLSLPLAGSIVVLCLVFGVEMLLSDVSPQIRLATDFLVGAAGYAAFVAVFDPSYVKYVISLVRRRRET